MTFAMPLENREQLIEVQRLSDVREISTRHRGLQRLDAGGGDQNGVDRGGELFQSIDQIQAVHSGQIKIDERYLRRAMSLISQ